MMTDLIRPELRASYRRCGNITRAHGTTYYWATCVLPRSVRCHVYAVYAFCRVADDIVDDLGDASAADRSAALAEYGATFRTALAAGACDDPILAAVTHTVLSQGIDPDCFERLLRSMRMDFTHPTYDTWEELMDYMDGSAAVIGEMMLPVIAPRPREGLLAPARALGLAFQLTNFLRDVGEDLDRGRIYLPQQDLQRFGADPRARVVKPPWRRLMQFEIGRCHELYERADQGIAMLPDRSARCITAARVLYARILERIAANDYDVFTQRARVSLPHKLATAGRIAAGHTARTRQ